ncbi:MAG: glycerol acyltransferase [Candidatus Thermochlorobacter aerophilum]|jgi:chlorobactene lauroyltransferase|uniref:Glycerol acyltransferase n=1 Tax=Candidatus Thermochlorobacter aerophilus TaxID=1868324 RepID=A0A395M1N5_9BACT|nr:MAG: glycerol acyltransferase [Candidatus Thermochlorobacter aerophilum]
MLTVRRSSLYTAWFRWYSRRAFKQHFDKVRVKGARTLATMNLQTPIIFYLNHSYWWDGFWSQLITDIYFNQNLYIIIEYKQLVRYQFFTRLGAFSIVRDNPREALKTIQYAAEKLTESSHRQNALWIFPQGVIEHVDKRPIKFFSGTAKIAEQVLERKSSVYLCSAVTRIDYVEEQKPELFISFHTPRVLTKETFPNPKFLTKEMEAETESHLDELKRLIFNREFNAFETILEGTRSVNRWYDSLKSTFGISTDTRS